MIVHAQKYCDMLINGDPLLEGSISNIKNAKDYVGAYEEEEDEHEDDDINIEDVVEKKLSQMILDKKLIGILDQGSSNIVIFDETPSDTQYQDALVIIQNMSKVVDTLFSKTK
ncbi:unnamed protein product [Rotaria sordida]|uniref:Uncharacterized protein n=1 Tax=Rotaria sordida TaxID=392033 RepID=A0A819Z1C1_9BILA|nr:unnamed protein product [Rotaria sordida]